MNDIDYKLEYLNDHHAHFEFTANIFKSNSIWRVHLYTCEQYKLDVEPNSSTDKQIINIEKDDETKCIHAQICLNIEKSRAPLSWSRLLCLNSIRIYGLGGMSIELKGYPASSY